MAKITKEEVSQLEVLMERWHRATGNVATVFKKFENDYLAYCFYRDLDNSRWKYNPTIPLVFTFVENYTASLMNTIFDKPHVFNVMPRERWNMIRPEIIDSEVARQVELALNAVTLDPDREFFEEILDAIKMDCIFGTSYTTTIPEFDMNDIDPDKGARYVGPRVECRDVFDVVPDMSARRLSKARWVFLKEWVSKEELRERENTQGYKNTKAAEEGADWLDTEEYRDSIMSKMGYPTRWQDGIDPKNENILLLHHWEHGHVTTVAANSVIVRDTRKPVDIETLNGTVTLKLKLYDYDIFDDWRMFPKPMEFYGTGLAEIARGAQADMELFASMRYENIALTLNAPWLANPLYDLDIDNILFSPDNIILSNDLNNALKKLEVPDITQSSYMEMAQRQQQAEEGTGMLELLRGSTPSRRETATTIVSLQRAGMKRVELMYKYINVILSRIARKIIIQMRQYMYQDEYERLTGKPDAGFYALSIEEILRSFDFTVSSTSLVQLKELEQQAFIQGYQILAQSPVINQAELARLYFEMFMPQFNPDRFIMQPQMPPIQAEPAGMVPPEQEVMQGMLPSPQNPERVLPQGVTPGDIMNYMNA